MPCTTKNHKIVTHIIPEPEGYDEELEAKIESSKKYHIWTENDEAKMRRYYGIVSTRDLARNIGVSIKQLQNKARDMELSFKEQQSKHLFGKEGAVV